MQPADDEHLEALMKRPREEFRDFAASYVPRRREDMETPGTNSEHFRL